MTFSVQVFWDAGFFGNRSYTLEADNAKDAEAKGKDLAWNELKELPISKRWRLRFDQLKTNSAKLSNVI